MKTKSYNVIQHAYDVPSKSGFATIQAAKNYIASCVGRKTVHVEEDSSEYDVFWVSENRASESILARIIRIRH